MHAFHPCFELIAPPHPVGICITAELLPERLSGAIVDDALVRLSNRATQERSAILSRRLAGRAGKHDASRSTEARGRGMFAALTTSDVRSTYVRSRCMSVSRPLATSGVGLLKCLWTRDHSRSE